MSMDRLHGIEAIFLDDGGTMSDNDRRAPQYRAILGDYLAPRLGSSPSAVVGRQRRRNRTEYERLRRVPTGRRLSGRPADPYHQVTP